MHLAENRTREVPYTKHEWHSFRGILSFGDDTVWPWGRFTLGERQLRTKLDWRFDWTVKEHPGDAILSVQGVCIIIQLKYRVKQSRYTPWRRLEERMHSSYSFTTSALDGGEWSVSRPGRALPPGKGPPVPIVQEAGWAPEPVWTQKLEGKSSAPAGDRTSITRSSSP
jgi:hypothetical protein